MKHRWPAIWIGLVTTAVALFTLWNILSQLLFRMALEADSRPIQCSTRLKQVTAAMLMYHADFDDRFPEAYWQFAIFPYTKNASMFTCPKVEEEGKVWGYAMNRDLKGAQISEAAIASMPIIFDVDELEPGLFAPITGKGTTRHDGHGWASYGDGSVRKMTRMLPEEGKP